MKKELVWRLSDRPSVEGIKTLLEAGVITKEEARTIAFNSVDENDKIAKLEQKVEVLQRALETTTHGAPLTAAWVTNTWSPGTYYHTVANNMLKDFFS